MRDKCIFDKCNFYSSKTFLLFIIYTLFGISAYLVINADRQTVNFLDYSTKYYHPVRKAFVEVKQEPKIQQDGFHLVTTFFVYTDPGWAWKLWNSDTHRFPTKQQLLERQNEVLFCLEQNLQNAMVSTINILYNRSHIYEYLSNLSLPMMEKLLLHDVKKEPTVSIVFQFISSHLVKKNVIYLHMDNYLASGFEKINLLSLSRENILYSLTRHYEPDIYCKSARESRFCNDGAIYEGSHDAFIFNLKRPISKEDLEYLTFTQNENGQENVLIWWLQTKLGFKVTNPCKILIIYHHHCLSIRERVRIRH